MAGITHQAAATLGKMGMAGELDFLQYPSGPGGRRMESEAMIL